MQIVTEHALPRPAAEHFYVRMWQDMRPERSETGFGNWCPRPGVIAGYEQTNSLLRRDPFALLLVTVSSLGGVLGERLLVSDWFLQFWNML